MLVADILSAKGHVVFTIAATRTITEAIAELNARNVGALVVVGAGRDVMGIVSERDIIHHIEGNDTAALLAQPVSQCMTPRPLTCSPQDTLESLMQTMTERRVRHIPVLDRGELVGIVSIGDAVKRKIEMTEQEAAALREYIAS